MISFPNIKKLLTFRCDDVSINTDIPKLTEMVSILKEKFLYCRIICGISPLVHDMSQNDLLGKERIFPKILNAYSDHRLYYKVDKAGIPNIEHLDVELAGHGLIHVDHRLLTKEVQEMSIMVSSHLVKANIFIPPFNKWNADTESICKEHKIELIKFEDGWKHLGYQKVTSSQDSAVENYYFHTHDFTIEDFKKTL